MNKIIFSLVFIGVLSVGSLVWADDTNRNMPTPTNLPASSTLKESLKDEMEKNRQEFNDMIKQKKTELEDKIKTKREELQKKLKNIQDVNKRQAVEKIDKQIDELNSKMMTHFSDMLDKMSAKLVKIGERADKAFQQGYDVSSVRTAIDNAKKSIDVVRSAIATQSGKTYAIQVTIDTALKGNVGKARDALHADVTAVKNILQAANEAVHKAATTLGQLKGQNPLSSVLPSPSVSPTSTQ